MRNHAMQRPVRGVKLPSLVFCVALLAVWLPAGGRAQVNSGSNGSDGAFNPTTSTNIDMTSRPSGIYEYTSVNIPSGVAVTFTPNASNTPVVWLVQSNVTIAGAVNLPGQSPYTYAGGGVAGCAGGPGGWGGGNGGTAATGGGGPGGGSIGGNGSFGSVGGQGPGQSLPGVGYGSPLLLPLLGGSGGGGWNNGGDNGGGGGGAILIAASGSIVLNGQLMAAGGNTFAHDNGNGSYSYSGGAGSGGAVRLFAGSINGTGSINVSGGSVLSWGGWGYSYSIGSGGSGRVRLDTFDNHFNGTISGAFSVGFQPIVIPVAGQGVQLAVVSVGGVAVGPSPSGVVATPDAVISGQQANPIPIVVRCTNLPLTTPVTVAVRPANGSSVSAVGYNNAGTAASSTATVLLNMPRGGGIIYATAATGN